MKILFNPITSSSIAHIIRSFALADKFISDGHEVFFTSCELKKDFIINSGYNVINTYKPFNLNDENDQSVNYLSSHKTEMVNWFKADIDAARSIKADVVISSPSFLGPHVTYALGIPTVTMTNGQYLPSSRGLMGLSFSTNRIDHKILRTLLRPVFIKNFIEEYLFHILDAYDKLGIDYPEKIRKGYTLYDQMHVMIPGDEEFEPQRYQYQDTKFIGPVFWNGFERIGNNLDEESIIRFKGKDKLIFVTFGGSVFSKDIYLRILEGLKKIKVKKIIALGPNFSRDEFPEDSSELIIKNFVPGLRLSKLSDVIVNTGSHGAIMQSLVHGKPVVAFPVGIDQAFFANRLEEMKLGRNVNKVGIFGFSKRESYQFIDNKIPENMVAAVEELLEDNRYTKNAYDYSKRIKTRHADPITSAANYVYELLN